MLDLIPYTLIGVGFGVLAGFIPGIGIFATLMILYPWLLDFTGLQLIAFYIGIASTTQYIGSVTATVFAVPGESSSLPSVIEGHALYKQGHGGVAISGAAIGSFVGSFIVLGIVSLFVPTLENLYYFYSTYIQAGIILLVIGLIILASSKKGIACILAFFGYILGTIGCRDIDASCFATFNNDDLTTGLPFISVILAMYIFPIVINNWNISSMSNSKIEIKTGNIILHLKKYWDNIGASLRGTVVGFFAGFTPGLSTTMSSNMCYALEKWVQRRKKAYQVGNYPSLVSAETGNNAGAFAALLPLIVLGIPIVPSEALLYELASAKGFILGGENFSADFFSTVAYLLVITNFIALVISWPFAKYICYISKLNYKVLQSIILFVLVGVIMHVGSQFWQSFYYLMVFLTLLPIGVMLRKYNMMPLVFAFLIAGRIDVVIISLKDLLL
jgi:putative tricarboxylic transport membrane protein|tara:strand:- start:885 stop:2216 length:1332 start_codon:yes stop_codon:yes gene_type:complete